MFGQNGVPAMPAPDERCKLFIRDLAYSIETKLRFGFSSMPTCNRCIKDNIGEAL